MRYPRVLQVARMGHPVLGKPALPVENPLAPEIQDLIEDMKETVRFLEATGIAAPQVFIPLQIAVFRIRPPHSPQMPLNELPWHVMINPEVFDLSSHKTSRWEGCLSIPDLAGWVERHDSLKCRYVDEKGEQHLIEAHGYYARAVQHECDHLQGILYPQRLKDPSDFGFRKEVFEHDERAKKQSGQPPTGQYTVAKT